MGGPDYIVDIKGLPLDGNRPGGAANPQGLRGRPWISVRWRCCGTYSRVYRNAAATAYEGRCPSCGKPVFVGVGPGGTDCRFFEAE